MSKILIAAAIISMLTVTAAAAEHVFGVSDWFRDILNQEIQEDIQLAQQDGMDLSIRETVQENQLQKIEELGQVKNESVTSEGTTVTLTALYSDEYVMHLYFRVTGPEGTVLPDDTLYAFHAPGSEYPILIEGDRMMNLSMELDTLPDSDPTDNQKDFHLTLSSDSYGLEYPDKVLFSDSVPKKFHIDGIYEQVVDEDGDEDGFHKIVPGEFTFDITNPVTVQRTEIDVTGLTYSGHAVRKWSHPEDIKGHFDWCPPYDESGVHTEEWDYSVTPTSLNIGPLSLEWACEYEGLSQFGCKIVMKDGTSPVFRGGGGYSNDQIVSTVFYSSIPIDLAEVDYILIGDEEFGNTHKVYLNP